MFANSLAKADAARLIKARAHDLGFEKVGIVAAEVLSDEQSHLQQWLGRGYHGEMKWMGRDPAHRADPRKLFPAARSAVVMAMNYYTPHEHRVSTGSEYFP